MKLSSFDARRLRPREQRNWGARLATAFSALLAVSFGCSRQSAERISVIAID